MHQISRGLRRAVIAIAVVFSAVACGAGALGGATGAGDLTIGIATPSDGGTVGLPFDVQLTSNVPLGEPETGNHHAHLYFDTSTSSADYDIVYGTTWQVTRPLSPGEHQVTVALANPDHSLAGPTQTIRITVGDGAAGSDAAPPSSGPGLDY